MEIYNPAYATLQQSFTENIYHCGRAHFRKDTFNLIVTHLHKAIAIVQITEPIYRVKRILMNRDKNVTPKMICFLPY